MPIKSWAYSFIQKRGRELILHVYNLLESLACAALNPFVHSFFSEIETTSIAFLRAPSKARACKRMCGKEKKENAIEAELEKMVRPSLSFLL